MRDARGFTLIEIMVALAILAVLSVLTAQSIQTAIANRGKVKADIAREASVRDALSVIQADVGAAYHFRDIQTEMMNDVSKASASDAKCEDPAKLTPDEQVRCQQQAASSTRATPRPSSRNLTGFVGNSNSMYFTISNHTRSTRNAAESNFAKVGYFVNGCRSRLHPGKDTNCLFRALETVLDDDVTQAGPASLLLENVEEFKLRFLGPGQEDFVEKWSAGAQGRQTSRQNEAFPYAVEISITMHDKNDPTEKPFSASVLAPIRFPNNAPTKGTPGQPDFGTGE